MDQRTSIARPRPRRTAPPAAQAAASPGRGARLARRQPRPGLVLVGVALACSCSFLSPRGNGGGGPAVRRQELERAAMLAGEPATTSPALPGDAPPAPRLLDLAGALQLALLHNRELAAARAAVDASGGDVAAARAALLPTVSARAGWNWFEQPQTTGVHLDPSLLPPGSTQPQVTVRQDDFGSTSAVLKLAIDAGGQLRHALGAAQAAYRAEEARSWAVRLEQERTVASAYFGLLEAERLAEVGRQAVALHERQLADAASLSAQGRLTRNGVLVVEVALSDARQAVMQLDNVVAAAQRQLNAATGIDLDAPTEARDVTGKPALPPLEQVLASAAATNPVVTALLEESRAAKERLAAARRERLPRVAASAGYDATTADIVSPNNYASAGVSVEVDLLNPRREGEITRLAATATRLDLALDRGARDVERMVRDAHDRLRERLAAIDATAASMQQAGENLRIRQAQFDEGRATSEDLLEASQLLTHQRALHAAALYQAHARWAELQQLAGWSLEGEPGQAGGPSGADHGATR